MDKNTFELEDNDAAIIIKADMSTEVVLPKMGDDENISFEEHQNVFITLAISGSMGDADFRKIIQNKLDEMFTKTADECGDESPCCPSDGGGCQGCG